MSAPSADGRPPISGLVICFNEEHGIERCLESLSFCDEIIVVDSHSTDSTASLAARYTDRVISQEFLGYIEQKNFAMEHATHDWVVCLDADEVLDDTLARAIRATVPRADEEVSGYVVDRVTHFLGIWHDAGEWYPDRKVRVFRRSRGRFAGRDPHEHIEVEGRVELLPGRLCHYNYRDLGDHIQTIDRFSTRFARTMHEEGVRFRLVDLLFRPPIRFLKGYFLRRGFTLGLPGFLVSVSTAYYVFMKYAKLWEIERSARR